MKQRKVFPRIEIMSQEEPVTGFLDGKGKPLPIEFLIDIEAIDEVQEGITRSLLFLFMRASQEPQIMKNPKTGEPGYWITVKGGRRVFVPMKKGPQQAAQPPSGEREGAPDAEALEKKAGAKTKKGKKKKGSTAETVTEAALLAAFMAVYVGFVGSQFFTAGKDIASMIKATKKNRDLIEGYRRLRWLDANKSKVGSWANYPFKNTTLQSLYPVPTELSMFEKTAWGEGMVTKYNIYKRTGFKPIGELKLIYRNNPVVGDLFNRFRSRAARMEVSFDYATPNSPAAYHSRFVQGFRALMKDSYELAQAQGIKLFECRIRNQQGSGLASIGFDFKHKGTGSIAQPISGDLEVAQKRGLDWLKNPTMRNVDAKGKVYKQRVDIPEKDLFELRRQVMKANTAYDHAAISYNHPQHGKINVGRDYMADMEWTGVIDIKSSNKGHALFYSWAYGKMPNASKGATQRPPMGKKELVPAEYIDVTHWKNVQQKESV